MSGADVAVIVAAVLTTAVILAIYLIQGHDASKRESLPRFYYQTAKEEGATSVYVYDATGRLVASVENEGFPAETVRRILVMSVTLSTGLSPSDFTLLDAMGESPR